MGKVMGMGEKMPELEVLRDKAIGAPPPGPLPTFLLDRTAHNMLVKQHILPGARIQGLCEEG